MSEPCDEQAAMQHYLVCGTEDCQKNGQFYCNACHRPLSEQSRDEHLKSPKTKTHEIVLYRHRKHQLPVKICELHPTRKVDMFCRECQIPLCSKCSTMKEHHTHTFDDLEDIYAEKYADWQGEFSIIQKYFIPTSLVLKTDIEKDVTQIQKTTSDKKIIEFTKTGDWKPLSVHSSCINGDILVGMVRDRQAKVTRYSKTGKEIQSMQRNNQGQELFSEPHYITENINGDICTSDNNKRAVVVVNKSGQHRFSYTGQRSRFCPYGICTDVLGHILVCDYFSNTVHLLDQDGGFLSVIISPQQGIKRPRSVCVKNENNLYVGQHTTNTVIVYKHLQ